jgi:predicted DCC family thiol-disulfide oxidoreductase YuxK
MTLFVNYFRSADRSTCLNLSVARVIVCCIAARKITSFPYSGMALFPDEVFAGNPYAFLAWLCPPTAGWILVEQAVTVALLLMCAVGLARRFAAFSAGLLLTHMEGVTLAVSSDKTSSLLAFFLIFYGLFCAVDRITLDALLAERRRSARDSAAGLMKNEGSAAVTLETLKWFLVAFAATYFLTGFGKWRMSGWGIAWGSAENIRLSLLHNSVWRTIPLTPFAQFLCDHQLLLALAGHGTMLFELGFLGAVLAGLPITPFVAGLIGLHVVLIFAMDVDYFRDMGLLHFTFFAWDMISARLQRSTKLTVAFDDRDPLCMGVLSLFKQADVAGGLRFVPSSSADAPGPAGAVARIRVIDEAGRQACGYDGVVALLAYQGLTRPIAWLMAIPPVAAVGRLISRRGRPGK